MSFTVCCYCDVYKLTYRLIINQLYKFNALFFAELKMCNTADLFFEGGLLQWRRNQFESGAGAHPAQSAIKKFCHALHLFGYKSTISRFCERFRDGQYSLVSLFFAVLLLTVPPVSSHL